MSEKSFLIGKKYIFFFIFLHSDPKVMTDVRVLNKIA